MTTSKASRRRLVVGSGAALLVLAGTAAAHGGTPTRRPRDVRDHRHQVGLALSLPVGLRILSPYDGEYCGDTSIETATGNSPVCAGRSPLSLDLTLSYGVKARLEVIAEVRLGLERDFATTRFDPAGTGPRVHHVAPGIRALYSDAGTSKVFSTAQAVIDFSSYGDDGGGTLGVDVGVRNLNGLQFDVDERWGFYGFVGETVSFTRWLRLEIEGGIGIQGRLP